MVRVTRRAFLAAGAAVTGLLLGLPRWVRRKPGRRIWIGHRW